MNTHEILIAAKALIDTPDKWIKGRYAATASGQTIGPDEKAATCFCSMGAIHRISENFDDASRAVIALEKNIPSDLGIISFNDYKTHAEVMAMFDRAIEETK